jgi:hypothetical protein
MYCIYRVYISFSVITFTIIFSLTGTTAEAKLVGRRVKIKDTEEQGSSQ